MNRNETLIQLEDLMLDLCSDKYHWQDADHELDKYRQAASDIYDPELEYSPMLQSYFDLVGLNQTRRQHQPLFHSETDFLNYCDDLLDEHELFISRHRRQRKRNFTVLRDRFEDALSDHCKLLLVRVDVSYPYDADMDISQLDKDLKILRRRIHRRENNFKNVVDYSWAIEQGRDKGYHCHLLLIYDGTKHMCDGYYGQQVAKVWMDITHDRGCYFNCNKRDHKENYRKRKSLGIGMIHRSDEQEVTNAIKAISYLAMADKEDQHLRAKIKGMRCFG